MKDSTEGFGGASNLVKLLLSGDLGRISHYPCASNVCEVWEFTEGPSAAQPYLSCSTLRTSAAKCSPHDFQQTLNVASEVTDARTREPFSFPCSLDGTHGFAFHLSQRLSYPTMLADKTP